MRRRFYCVLCLGALCLATAPAASASRVETRVDEFSALGFGSVGCNQEASATAGLGPRVGSVRVVTPTVGQAFYDFGSYVGRISRVEVLRGNGRTSVRFTVRGEGALCDGDSVASFPAEVDYVIRYRYRLAKRELGYCGKVWMYYTRAAVEANGYTRCRGAKALARTWRNRQACGMRCWLPRRRVRGFTCVLRHDSETSSPYVKCRRGKRFVTWAWGD